MDRRHALGLMGGLVGAGVAGLGPAPARAAQTPVIEWNQHMFSANTAKFPFHPQAVYKPDPSSFQADPLAAYEKHMKGYSAADIAKVKGGNLQKLLNWS